MRAISSLVLCVSVLVAAALQSQFLSPCAKYDDYSRRAHRPLSRGDTGLAYQRPHEQCRLFRAAIIETEIERLKKKIVDPDISRLLENCLPNTLDTTIRWHDPREPETFVITGDIDAMWLRDSTFQLQPYLRFLKDDALRTLVNGVIQTQAKYITQFPYCNAFQPPRRSKMGRAENHQHDTVFPPYDPDVVFECKYEIDSLSSFLRLSRQYYERTQDSSILTMHWIAAVQKVLRVVQEQSRPSFNEETHHFNHQYYSFRRQTDKATETLAMDGSGYLVNTNTSLVRSAFRPSDDSTILQYFIPGNAMLSVELGHLATLLKAASAKGVQAADAWSLVSRKLSERIRQGIYEHAVFEHPIFGSVFAYEIDGYGGRIFMDDANMPSLLSLPLLGFLSVDDEIYQNTRKMILSSHGNPHFLNGKQLQGIGSPHTPVSNVWPMSLLVQIMTSTDESEIAQCLQRVVSTTAGLGLIHESINAWSDVEFTRPWFAWANALFATTIYDIEERFPHLLFAK